MALATGTYEEKQTLRNVLAVFVSVDSDLQYKHCGNLVLKCLEGDQLHPPFVYFIKNWDDITDEWVSFK